MDTAFLTDVSLTDAKRDWVYLSEGGATIVFTYRGPSHPTYNSTVLRLRKAPRHRADSQQSASGYRQDEPDDPSIAFQDSVTSKLIPSEHLPKLQAVRVTQQWLKDLESVVEGHRPVFRTTRDGIDTSRYKAVLATDLVGGKGWAVEIKPKWGFLPRKEYLSPATRDLKTQCCRFCMHSHLKVAKEGSAISEYCPLDLFSGDEVRIRNALRSLWDHWICSHGKGNNLRLFNEGKIVHPGDIQSLTDLARKLHVSELSAISASDLLPSFVDAVLPLILEKPLIPALAHLQRTLDPLDIEGLVQLWYQVHSDVPIGQGEPEPTLEEWHEFVRTYLSEDEGTSERKDTLRYNILAYLLSATFKDCSVILGLEDATKGGKAEDTITVIDLDPKSVSRLSKWSTLDQEIVENFAGVTMRKVCIDAHKVFIPT